MVCRLEVTERPDSQLLGLRVFECPFGHRSYRKFETENCIGIQVVEFRRTANRNIWHFVKSCSQWSTDDFVSVGYLPAEAIVCNECFSLKFLPQVISKDSISARSRRS